MQPKQEQEQPYCCTCNNDNKMTAIFLKLIELHQCNIEDIDNHSNKEVIQHEVTSVTNNKTSFDFAIKLHELNKLIDPNYGLEFPKD